MGNGCVGNEVGGCGHETGLKIHVDFYHDHALFPDVSVHMFTSQSMSIFSLPIQQTLYQEMLKECGDFMNIKWVLVMGLLPPL